LDVGYLVDGWLQLSAAFQHLHPHPYPQQQQQHLAGRRRRRVVCTAHGVVRRDAIRVIVS